MAAILETFDNLPDSHKHVIYTVAGAAAAYIFYKKVIKNCCKCSKVQIHEKNWKKDTVYLFQFPRAEFLPNHSPFALKLEALMKLYNIPYEIRTIKSTRSKYGLVPFIELNGQHFADSQLIELYLQEHFKIPDLSPAEEAIARPVCRMLESHTFPVMLKSKILDHPENISLVIDGFKMPTLVRYFLEGRIINMFQKRVAFRMREMLGGMFTDADFEKLLKKDLNALNNVLGDKKFILGDRITQPDCTVFAQLATLYYLPTENDTKKLISTEFPALGGYVNRVRDQIFGEQF